MLTIGGLCATVLTTLRLKQPPKQEDETEKTVTLSKEAVGFLSFDRRCDCPVDSHRESHAPQNLSPLSRSSGSVMRCRWPLVPITQHCAALLPEALQFAPGPGRLTRKG